MPLVFSSSEDLKKKLLNSSKKWRDGLKKAKEAKDEGVRNMADSVEQAFDDCVSFNHLEKRLEAISEKEAKLERACRANTAATQRGDI